MENTLERCYECCEVLDNYKDNYVSCLDEYLCGGCIDGWVGDDEYNEMPEYVKWGEKTDEELINIKFDFASEEDNKNLDKYLEEYSTLNFNFKKLRRSWWDYF